MEHLRFVNSVHQFGDTLFAHVEQRFEVRSVGACVVPIGTRSVQLTLALSRLDGSYDDGYAVNLSVVFTAGREPSAAFQLLLVAGGIGALAIFHRRKTQLSR
jgi:hypothetical protein